MICILHQTAFQHSYQNAIVRIWKISKYKILVAKPKQHRLRRFGDQK